MGDLGRSQRARQATLIRVRNQCGLSVAYPVLELFRPTNQPASAIYQSVCQDVHTTLELSNSNPIQSTLGAPLALGVVPSFGGWPRVFVTDLQLIGSSSLLAHRLPHEPLAPGYLQII